MVKTIPTMCRIGSSKPPNEVPHDQRDYLHIRGATTLARSIEDIWASHGWKNAACVLEPTGIKAGKSMLYGVRSNLVNGLPPS